MEYSTYYRRTAVVAVTKFRRVDLGDVVVPGRSVFEVCHGLRCREPRSFGEILPGNPVLFPRGICVKSPVRAHHAPL